MNGNKIVYYILIILATDVFVILGNAIATSFDLWQLLWISVNTVICTVGVIAWDGLGALIVRRLLPPSWFRADRRFFRVGKRERNFYRSMKIGSWKDKVPELGVATGFSKSDYTGSNDIAYLGRFLLENNFGVICHLENALLGFLILFIPYWGGQGSTLMVPGMLSIWLPVAIVNFILSMLPVFILRYTSYTLQRLYQKQVKLAAKRAAAEAVGEEH